LTRGFDAPFGPFGASSCLFLELFDTGACLNPDSARRPVYFLSHMCGPKGRVQTTRFRPRNCGSRVPILLIVTQCAVLAPYESGRFDCRMGIFLRHRGLSPVSPSHLRNFVETAPTLRSYGQFAQGSGAFDLPIRKLSYEQFVLGSALADFVICHT